MPDWAKPSDFENVLALLNMKRVDVGKSPIYHIFSGWVKQSDIDCLRNGLIGILGDYGFTSLLDALHCAGYDYDTWKIHKPNWIMKPWIEIEDILKKMETSTISVLGSFVDGLLVGGLLISGQVGQEYHTTFTPYNIIQVCYEENPICPCGGKSRIYRTEPPLPGEDSWGWHEDYTFPKAGIGWIGARQMHSEHCLHSAWAPTSCWYTCWKIWDSDLWKWKYYACYTWVQISVRAWNNVTIKSVGDYLGTEKYNILDMEVIDPMGTKVADYFTEDLLRKGGAINFSPDAGVAKFGEWDMKIKVAYHTCIGE